MMLSGIRGGSIVEIEDTFISLFEKEIDNVDIKYLLNVYVLKMSSLVSLEIMLVNNFISDVGLDEITKG